MQTDFNAHCGEAREDLHQYECFAALFGCDDKG
jgi:hypothetical protein